MSVKEAPVCNRYLDLKEKEKAYRKHISALARARPTINTTQPEPARRVQVAQQRTTSYRKNLIRNIKAHEVMVADVSPRSAKTPTRKKVDWNELSSRRPVQPSQYDDLDLFSRHYEKYRPKTAKQPNYELLSTSDDDEFPEPSDVSSVTSSSSSLSTPRSESSTKSREYSMLGVLLFILYLRAPPLR